MARSSALHFFGSASLLVVAAGLLIRCPAPVTATEPSRAVEPGKAAADPARTTVSVLRDLGGGRSRAGTGTVIACEAGKSLVLTNAHVADAADGVYTVTHAGTAYPATYVGGSAVSYTTPNSSRIEGPDLALVSVETTLPAATLAPDAPRAGDRVRLWGFGGRLAEQGAVEKAGQALDSAGYVEPTFVSTTDTTSGDSGSGVFNDAGELVAVHWGGAERQAYAVPLGTVRSFLREKARESFPRLTERVAAQAKRESQKAAPERADPASATPGP
jgi:S1-C subfamily serine protease